MIDDCFYHWVSLNLVVVGSIILEVIVVIICHSLEVVYTFAKLHMLHVLLIPVPSFIQHDSPNILEQAATQHSATMSLTLYAQGVLPAVDLLYHTGRGQPCGK